MYTTLSRVFMENKASDTSSVTPSTQDKRAIMQAIQKVTARIKRVSWDFEPSYGTEYFTAWAGDTNIYSGLLQLTNPKGQLLLLASAADGPSISVNGAALTFGLSLGTTFQVMPYPVNQQPIKTLRLNDANAAYYQTWLPTCLPWIEQVQITGWWGYNRNFASAFVSSGQTVQDVGGINASVTTITVTDSTGNDALYWSPCLDWGNLIRIENELMQVVKTDTTHLYVQRGVNGTTAASHAQNTAISVWYPEEDVQDTVSRQAAYFYTRRGAYEKVAISGLASVQYPVDMVDELYAMLQGYENE